MKPLPFNLRDLQYLIALAESGHFGRAAETCFVSQPTLSAQIKKLERTLGVILIERSPRQALLTPIGAEIAMRARRVLAEANDLSEAALRSRDPLGGPLALGAIPTLGPYLLPHVIGAIREALPRLELRLHEQKTMRLLQCLRDGEIDLGLLALPIEAPGLETAPLFEEPFLLAAPAGHPLMEKRVLSLDDIDDFALLLLDEGHCLREQALEVCRSAGAREQQGFRATSLETLRNMVAAGSGLTLLPRLAVVDAPSGVAVSVRPFRDPVPHRVVGAAWRKGSARRAAIDALCAIVREHAARVLSGTAPAADRDRTKRGHRTARNGA